MNKRTVKLISVITAVALLAYALMNILDLLLRLVSPTLILPTYLLLWLSVMIPCVILLVSAIKGIKQKKGVLHVILHAVSLLIGVFWGFFGAMKWVLYTYQINMLQTNAPPFGMSFGAFYELLIALKRINSAMVSLCAIGLLVVFVINFLVASQKWLQIKAELHKPAAAIMVLVPASISLVQTILNTLIFNSMSTQIYASVIQAFGIVSFAVELLMAVAFAALVLVLGLCYKKQPAAVAEQQPAQPEIDLPEGIDLPCGVDPSSFDT